MPVKSQKMGPGTFTLGAGPTAFSDQVRDLTIQVTENVQTTEAIPVLSGSEIPAEEDATYKYAVAVGFLTDVWSNGIAEYTWDNEGITVPFSFVPNTAAGSEIEGSCRIVPINVGGTAKQRMQADVVFQCPEKPTPTWAVEA